MLCYNYKYNYLAYHNWEWRAIHDNGKYGCSEPTEELSGIAMKGKEWHENNSREHREHEGEETKNFSLFLPWCQYDEDQHVYDFYQWSSAIHCWH